MIEKIGEYQTQLLFQELHQAGQFESNEAVIPLTQTGYSQEHFQQASALLQIQ